MTTAINLQSKILSHVSQIAGKYNVHVRINQTGVITAEHFENAGKLMAFKLDIEDFLKTLNLWATGIHTTYNPYEVRISWRE